MAKFIVPQGSSAIAAAAASYKDAAAAAAAAAEAKSAAAAALLDLMMQSDLAKCKVPCGTVSVINGRQTIEIVCPALEAEIKLIKERSVRTGRGKIKVGSPYVTVR